ncbi:hypothetical protein EMIHUDRAFT_223432 [Emiliania huxleyi CCMP1516]|uniref:B30.2/SPRY domain-containing protein n=2 Tax=Emiliania huxleyi TaxID=2903 RepID=A0A0D3KVT1_EMIH1|nr:hypothetical protein EMIHUDRAFT_223432 [Emiliania huxleyi CCMP1516]EOD39866.1 hypothetical protein EMIHUDRAFT_223432 [Emiliania huxleyi CCMP1516]|eukprot:XP_005792295.1 hypothetical protein EMIHUDRAFT_223432 [Emiliania huxleyi CCMP1516]
MESAADYSPLVLEDPDLLCTILAQLPDAHALVAAAAVARLWRVQGRDDRVWRALYRKVWGPRVGSAEPPLRDVRVGCFVELSGLTARPDLNGRVAQVLDNEADGTWRVKPVNLVAWERYLRDQIEVMTRAYSLPPLFGETLSAEDYAASTLDEEALHVQPQNLHGQWRLRFRRRHTGFEFVNLLGGSGQVQVDEHGFSTAVGLQTLTYRHHGLVLRGRRPLQFIEDELAYFEVSTSASSVGVTVGSAYDGQRALHIGWRSTAYGYHSDDGAKWRHDAVAGPRTNGAIMNGVTFGEPFGGHRGSAVDTVGCGLDLRRRSVFFTKNGKLQGTAFENCCLSRLCPRLYPTVALHEDGDRCRFNFGAEPFLFDIAAFAVSDARTEVGGRPALAGPRCAKAAECTLQGARGGRWRLGRSPDRFQSY